MTTVLAGVLRMVLAAWRTSRGKTVLAAALVAVDAAAVPVLAAALGRMTDAVVAGDGRSAAVAGVVVAAMAVASVSVAHLAHLARFELAELAELDFDEQLIALSNGSPGITHHERADLADALTVLQRESRQLSVALGALLRGVGLGLTMLLTAVLLARLTPVLLVLPLAAVPPLLTGRWAERIHDRARTETAQRTRMALNLFNLCTSARPAGELRVFRLQREVRRRHRELWDAVTRRLFRADLAATWIRALGQLVFALAYVGAVLLVLRDAIGGRRSVGDVVLVVTLAAQVNLQVTAAVAVLQDLQRMASVYRRLDRYRAGTAVAEPPGAEVAEPARLRDGIVFEGVDFAYPDQAALALRSVDLVLPAGSTVAIVGENGAGKSTLVKLLCGFYLPSRGRILVDGVDLRRLPIDRWRRRIAAGFQDFARYEFRARHAVGVGDLSQEFAPPAVSAALDRAYAGDVLKLLPEGLDTHLGKSYNPREEQSGGQWQKVALGRALMRQTPLLLVLDEPTSALDAEAEHRLFERYARQARRAAAAAGTITVLVSHRCSTVRMADVIVVVSGGRVVETGAHADLVRAGGVYADLIALQAKAYR
jgi:ATP-binding cassette subfamily B protein